MFNPHQTQEEETPFARHSNSRTPIWAPNPGVPFLARVLAYAFGVLMIFTVVISKVSIRPADIPEIPQQSEWRTFSNSNFSIAYPDGWEVYQNDKQKFVSFFPIPDEYISVQTLFFRNNDTLTDADFEMINEAVERFLSKDFVDYAPGGMTDSPDLSERWHRFSGKMLDEEKRPITGAWVLKVHGANALFLEAISSEDGWKNMSQILSTMSGSVMLADDEYPANDSGENYQMSY